jgi:hypothetical protein
MTESAGFIGGVWIAAENATIDPGSSENVDAVSRFERNGFNDVG